MFKITLFTLMVSAIVNAADMPLTDYELVPASQTAQVLGVVGGQGDVLDKLIIVPGAQSVGAVQIHDGAGHSVNVYVGGLNLVDVKPFVVHIGARSSAGSWRVTTGSNVSVLGVGRFK